MTRTKQTRISGVGYGRLDSTFCVARTKAKNKELEIHSFHDSRFVVVYFQINDEEVENKEPNRIVIIGHFNEKFRKPFPVDCAARSFFCPSAVFVGLL